MDLFVILAAVAILIGALRIRIDVDEHEQIMHDDEYEK
jgi:hypothetical protein